MADRRDEDLEKQGISDSTEGKIDNLKGKAKDAWGGATGDLSKQAEGKFDQVKGNVKDRLGEAERNVARQDRDADDV